MSDIVDIENAEDEIEDFLQFIINYKDMLEQSITSMSNKIEYNKEELDEVKKFLVDNCKHDVEIDYVDSIKNGEVHSVILKYCKICNTVF
jgi:hypothetical protein